ncbi:hypothetical protein E3E14_02045 [Streptomyces sp. ICN441]|nr:hypothetical protein E3E14_02045 [Streptomyces sp. ICN441]
MRCDADRRPRTPDRRPPTADRRPRIADRRPTPADRRPPTAPPGERGPTGPLYGTPPSCTDTALAAHRAPGRHTASCTAHRLLDGRDTGRRARADGGRPGAV